MYKVLDDFENYIIYDNGKIFSTKRKLFLKPEITNAGYERVNLYRNGKRFHKSAHRIVAEMFVPNPCNLPIVNHKDENKLNNNAVNLEWVSITENTNYGTALKRRAENQKLSMSTRKPIIQYDEKMNLIKEYCSIRQASRETGFASGHIAESCKKHNRRCGGYYFRYKKEGNSND